MKNEVLLIVNENNEIVSSDWSVKIKKQRVEIERGEEIDAVLAYYSLIEAANKDEKREVILSHFKKLANKINVEIELDVGKNDVVFAFVDANGNDLCVLNNGGCKQSNGVIANNPIYEIIGEDFNNFKNMFYINTKRMNINFRS